MIDAYNKATYTYINMILYIHVYACFYEGILLYCTKVLYKT
jgi:hypothetical protein